MCELLYSIFHFYILRGNMALVEVAKALQSKNARLGFHTNYVTVN